MPIIKIFWLNNKQLDKGERLSIMRHLHLPVESMKLISFDALRTLRFPSHSYVKPELFFRHKDDIQQADWVLFPEYWQINALVYGLKANIFPSLPTYLIGHNKVEMTRVFEAIVPEHMPWTLIHGNTPERADYIWETLPLPFVAKIPKSSMGEGVFLIENRADWNAYCNKTDVLYAQEYLPIDRDLRLVVIGDKVVSGYWRIQSDNGFHNNIARGGTMVSGYIPPAAIELVEKVARALGVDHAGFDVAMVGEHPFLFEFNRVFGTQGVESLIGDLTPLIVEYLSKKRNEFDPTSPNEPKGPKGPKASQGGRRVRLKRAA